MQIRGMLAGDVDAAVRIITAHLKVDGRLSERYYRRYFSDGERQANPREQNRVATIDGQVVGVAGYGPDKYDWQSVLWINWIYVDPGHRRKGIGSALLTHILDEMRALGVRKAYLDTSPGQTYGDAIRMYEKFGFRTEGLLKDYYNTGDDFLIMGLVL